MLDYVTVSTKAQSVPSARHVVGVWRSLTKPLYWFYEQRLFAAVKQEGHLPKHIGVIMDGNRRFARTIGLDVKTGHDYGAGKAREVLDWCLELGIGCVTLWGFSSENRGRTPDEVHHLHSLFAKQAKELLHDERLHKNKVRVKVIGNVEDFPDDTKAALRKMEEATASYNGMQLNIALGYGGREEIVDAVKRLLHDQLKPGVKLASLVDQITPQAIQDYLYTAGMPDPDFVIRTSGEVRLSGFLLWQTAYSEFYFCDAFWPSFRKVDFLRAIRSFQARERRFGK